MKEPVLTTADRSLDELIRSWRHDGERPLAEVNPHRFRRLLYRRWMAFARRLATISNAILLGLFYILVLAPVALVARLIGKDLLDRRIGATASFWKQKHAPDDEREHSRRQF